MPSKRRREQWKSARAASLEVFKKRRLETSLLPTSAQLRIDDRKLSTADTTNTDDTDDTENESGTWFWNESANETDTEEEGNGNHENDLEEDESKTEEAASSGIHKVEIKWNREGEEKLRGGYGKGSRRTQMRKQKSTRELEKEASKKYDIRALWQRNKDLGMSLSANSQAGLEQPTKSPSIDSVSSIPPVSKILRGGLPSLSKQQIHRNQ